jgi:hypothetical protein
VLSTLERLEANEQAERHYLVTAKTNEIATNLINLKMELQDISIATGLSVPKLQKLKENIEKKAKKKDKK